MRALLAFTGLRLADITSEMAAGRIDISPYRTHGSTETACRFCDYRSLCRFDPGAGDTYRRLARGKDEEFWTLIEERVRGTAGAGEGGAHHDP